MPILRLDPLVLEKCGDRKKIRVARSIFRHLASKTHISYAELYTRLVIEEIVQKPNGVFDPKTHKGFVT